MSAEDAPSEDLGMETGEDAEPDPRFAAATDCHVHLMPDRLMAAIREALTDEGGWAFPHPTAQAEMERALRAHGVERYVALPYAHKPGMARELNEWVVERAETSEMAVPFATVHGDDDVGEVVREAFEAGARGLKFQCPVQRCGPADPRLDPAFELAAEYDRPILFHAGTAPMFRDSPHVGADQFEQFLQSYPDVRAASAHLGAYEVEAFCALARDHDNAFLDTCFTMSSAVGESMDFDPDDVPDSVFEDLSHSIMYGSDYPNIPHSYRSERENLLGRDLPESVYDDLFRETAERFLYG
nr:amidohydrolase family protein [Halomarina sp. BCD28]